jgi:hypothetical protein
MTGIRIVLVWSQVWFGAAISKLVSGIRVLGSVEEEKLVGVLNGNYFPIHSFHFTGNLSGVAEL